jgi:hypothetical protein
MELALADTYRRQTGSSRLSGPFLDLRQPDASTVPVLFLNGTSVDTGRRIVATAVRWSPRDPTASDRDVEDLHTLLGADISVATAVHNTARFPYVSAAGRLRDVNGGDRGHIVDGGYFENTGADTLRDVINVLRTVPTRVPVEFVALILRNTPPSELPPKETEAAWRPIQQLGELFSPLRAVLRTREAHGEQALRDLGSLVGVDHLLTVGECPDPSSPKHVDAPLGWEMSTEVFDRLDADLARCVPEVSAAVARFLEPDP